MDKSQEVSDYYDKYVERQEKIWHNERHFFLIDQLKKAGLKSGHQVLEIGCGVGTMSNLIAPSISPGKLTATDISPKSVEAARKYNAAYSNAEFFTADSTDTVFPSAAYDFIVLLDVMEHIPPDHRENLIRAISNVMTQHTVLVMNVPAPAAHLHAKEHFPEAMQLIEEPVYPEQIIPLFANHDLVLTQMMTYDLWQKDEYQYYEFRKRVPYTFEKTQPPAIYNPHSLVRRIKRKLGFGLK